ncbi:hypothetical protein Back11_62260 [Paenibacillus baekrokdamisoli]|uniref:Uncharacterized protein n=1 Tax=Paenibacillus baekrokdamisoli TaxID=1712516 RepID=A0A3G9JG55_9BACL|nr:hypothetical protein [Paenibacillus baekrokdamisoli]MBB3069545.1 hypothetical protein [Paenibacillus baekrokdamisoli]BBH24881.1 hypothetical protein Back11_62260 [Paenibacillus baekrokdamisoli]
MKNKIGNNYVITFNRLMASLLIVTGLLVASGCSSDNTSDTSQNKSTSEQKYTSPGKKATAAVSSKPASNPYEAAGIADAKAFDTMFEAVQAAVAKDDKETVAANILYPLRVNGTGSAMKVENKEEFLKQYDMIFTAPVKQALAQQKIDSLFVNYQGVMVGNGEIWFGGDIAAPQKLGIITINHDIETKTK